MRAEARGGAGAAGDSGSSRSSSPSENSSEDEGGGKSPGGKKGQKQPKRRASQQELDDTSVASAAAQQLQPLVNDCPTAADSLDSSPLIQLDQQELLPSMSRPGRISNRTNVQVPRCKATASLTRPRCNPMDKY